MALANPWLRFQQESTPTSRPAGAGLPSAVYSPLQSNPWLNQIMNGWVPPEKWVQPAGYGVIGGGVQTGAPPVIGGIGGLSFATHNPSGGPIRTPMGQRVTPLGGTTPVSTPGEPVATQGGNPPIGSRPTPTTANFGEYFRNLIQGWLGSHPQAQEWWSNWQTENPDFNWQDWWGTLGQGSNRRWQGTQNTLPGWASYLRGYYGG